MEAARLEKSETTKEEYDEWRYKYPELDTHQIWAKVPSQEGSAMLLARLKEIEKEKTKEAKRQKIGTKKPYSFSVVISENQQGFPLLKYSFIQQVTPEMLPNRFHFLNRFTYSLHKHQVFKYHFLVR